MAQHPDPQIRAALLGTPCLVQALEQLSCSVRAGRPHAAKGMACDALSWLEGIEPHPVAPGALLRPGEVITPKEIALEQERQMWAEMRRASVSPSPEVLWQSSPHDHQPTTCFSRCGMAG